MEDRIYHDGAIHAPISTWPKFCPSCGHKEIARRTSAKTNSGLPATRLTCDGCKWTERYVIEQYAHRKVED